MSSSAVTSITAQPREHARWFGHPPGLTILFLTEMWEKFSYFGMRALLVYYMTKSLAMRQEDASWVYGGSTSLAYFTPIVGGLLIERQMLAEWAWAAAGLAAVGVALSREGLPFYATASADSIGAP